MPVLRIDEKTKSLINTKDAVKKGHVIHSFDPDNLSLPKYSNKYAEKNAGAYSHLAGGMKDDITNN